MGQAQSDTAGLSAAVPEIPGTATKPSVSAPRSTSSTSPDVWQSSAHSLRAAYSPEDGNGRQRTGSQHTQHTVVSGLVQADRSTKLFKFVSGGVGKQGSWTLASGNARPSFYNRNEDSGKAKPDW